MADLKVVIGGDVSGATTGLKQVQTELGKTAIAAQKVDSSLATTAKSFIGVGSKAQIASTALTGIGQAVGGAVEGVASLGSALLTGGILVAIPLIITGVKLLGEALFGATAAQKEFAAQQDRINESFEGAKSSYVKAAEVVQNLKIAFKQAEDGVISQHEAVKLYNDTIGKTTGSVNSLAEAEAELAKKGDAYIKFTLLKAAANIALAKSAEEAFKAEFAQQQSADISANLSAQAKAAQSKGGAIVGVQVRAVREQVDALNKEREKDLKNQERYLEIQKTFASRAEDIAKGFNFTGKGDTPVKEKDVKTSVKNIETIADVLTKLRKELDFLNTKELELHTDEAKAKISALDGAIKTLITKFGVKGKENTVQLFAEIRALESQEALKAELFKNSKFGVLKVPVEIEPVLNTVKKGIFEDRLKAFDDFKKDALARLKSVQEIIGHAATDVGASIGDALGNGLTAALQGKSFGSVLGSFFSSIFKAVGNGLRNLGVYFLAASKLVASIKKALLAVPALSAVAAIGLIALGTLISSIGSKATPGFATGVRNFQGGSAIVGERGPERVFLPTGSTVQPNNELQAYGGGSNGFIAETRIQGQELVILINRAKATMSRNG